MRITAIILTHNESLHIERAIRSIQAFADQIFVVDSGSTDGTTDIARRLGAQVCTHAFVNQARQFQWALDTLDIRGDWVLRLDADEIIEPDLAREIAEKLPRLPTDVVGVNLKRKHIFMDRWVRHGGRYPLRMLRLWRQGHGRIENRWMDEHMVVWGGRTVTFDGGFADHNLKDLAYFIDKHNRYATREAIEVLNQRLGLFAQDGALNARGASHQAAFKRWAKERIYNRIPFTLSATLYFVWRYVFQRGFLDGRSGLVYHFLQGYWYRFLVGARVMELQQAVAHLHDKAAICAELSRLTGHKLVAQSDTRPDVDVGDQRLAPRH
ncbi:MULTISPECIES: glycosyltransferase family 2 protein [unclassified Hydrogenophaga]|jgi:glycosyltransferase involved in cell wall biosynthesis|uniref:glycosyltransferase family 2 protein n=1 Tax=unclassified Hydrogenophaga TaxID=2610897 RepID=UPI0009659E5F|nr:MULTISPECIES: glycosyltransferase family 2 protein [unclassified Hydrogenophaga]MBN9373177.1 glycosyltransferase family 2 protein [Hydrogenophaga sp.]OJV58374.1 MAG: glycosyl transferase [Hydrogenophaga sp. 70-12]